MLNGESSCPLKLKCPEYPNGCTCENRDRCESYAIELWGDIPNKALIQEEEEVIEVEPEVEITEVDTVEDLGIHPVEVSEDEEF